MGTLIRERAVIDLVFLGQVVDPIPAIADLAAHGGLQRSGIAGPVARALAGLLGIGKHGLLDPGRLLRGRGLALVLRLGLQHVLEIIEEVEVVGLGLGLCLLDQLFFLLGLRLLLFRLLHRLRFRLGLGLVIFHNEVILARFLGACVIGVDLVGRQIRLVVRRGFFLGRLFRHRLGLFLHFRLWNSGHIGHQADVEKLDRHVDGGSTFRQAHQDIDRAKARLVAL